MSDPIYPEWDADMHTLSLEEVGEFATLRAKWDAERKRYTGGLFDAAFGVESDAFAAYEAKKIADADRIMGEFWNAEGPVKINYAQRAYPFFVAAMTPVTKPLVDMHLCGKCGFRSAPDAPPFEATETMRDLPTRLICWTCYGQAWKQPPAAKG